MLINDACDYVILKLTEGTDSLSNIKLQKLLYYIEAWHLAFHGKKLFQENENFQAWIHGPVSKDIYKRFAETKSLYSSITDEDIREDFSLESQDEKSLKHIDTILETYAVFSGTDLEIMTHDELPWQNAREGYRKSERCEVTISNADMESYYKERLS